MMSIQTQQQIYDRYQEDYNKSSFKQLFKRKDMYGKMQRFSFFNTYVDKT